MCVSKHETFLPKKSKFCPILYLGYLKERKKKEVFDIIYEAHLCSRASEREREKERKEERKREEEKERGRGEKRREDETSLEKGSHFLRRRRSFSKKKPFAFECAKGILSNLGVYNA